MSHGTMLAAAFDGSGKPLAIVQRPVPDPAPHQIVLKVGRCGICGTDLHMTEPRSTLAAGSIMGHEIAGEVVATGSAVTQVKAGDRVAALPIEGCGECPACSRGEPRWCERGMTFLAGGYAQYALADERSCLVLPSGLSLADGALVEPLAVALHGIRMVPDLRGLNVLVLGAGPIGLSAVFWARRMGAAKVTVVEGNESRIEMAMAMGASAALPPSDRTAGDRRGVGALHDIVFECVGRPGLLSTAIRQVRARGTVVSLGFCMLPEQLLASEAAAREVTLKFPILYSLKDYQMTLDALSAGHVEPRAMVTGTVGFDELPERFEQLRRPGTDCKVMIDPWAGC